MYQDTCQKKKRKQISYAWHREFRPKRKRINEETNPCGMSNALHAQKEKGKQWICS